MVWRIIVTLAPQVRVRSLDANLGSMNTGVDHSLLINPWGQINRGR